MQITLKLYAGLSQYLPEKSKKHSTNLNISPSETVFSILDKFNVPKESAHLVLLNGVYLQPEEREQPKFNEGDTLAVWPPVAGG
ncbi:MAG TPA: MoaD/ThiS family protein [Thiotrichaceae bacterium]|jgi:sulfur carrier protein ThiS|nr:MoaD/ThiS family protein [Thiotrichaceae bacterium]HIM08221.1 MoaD/ThiS family protein [Gammaproteobacteria bacterium]